jgi:hypothetical protein
MYVAYLFAGCTEKEIREAVVPRREFKMWKTKIFLSHIKGEADCGDGNLETFKATMSPDGTPSHLLRKDSMS